MARLPYRTPENTYGAERFMNETLPQFLQIMMEQKRYDQKAASDQAQQLALQKYRNATIEQSEKDRDLKEFNMMLDALKGDHKAVQVFLEGYQSSSAGEDMDVGPLIRATKEQIQSNQKGELFYNDFRFGKVSDLQSAWGDYYGLDPNDAEDLKWFNQAKAVQDREAAEIKNTYTQITSLATAANLFKDSEGRLNTEGQELMAKLRDKLLLIGKTGIPLKPIIIGGKKIVLPKNAEQMSSQEIMDAIAGQIRNDEMEEGYADLLSDIGIWQTPVRPDIAIPAEEEDISPNLPLTELTLQEFTPWEDPPPPPAGPYTGGIPTRPEIAIPSEEEDISPNLPLTDLMLQEFTPWESPPPGGTPPPEKPPVVGELPEQILIPTLDSTGTIPVGASLNTVDGYIYDDKTGERQYKVTEEESQTIINDYKDYLVRQNLAFLPDEELDILPDILSVNVVKSGITSSIIDINGVQKPVTPTELSVLQKSGKRWDLLPEKRRESIAGKLAKKFNTTKESIMGIPPAVSDAPKLPKIDNFIMIKEGVSKSKIELNSIQANVTPTELSILRGQDRFGLDSERKNKLIARLAKKFNVTEDDIKRLPFEKYRRKKPAKGAWQGDDKGWLQTSPQEDIVWPQDSQ